MYVSSTLTRFKNFWIRAFSIKKMKYCITYVANLIDECELSYFSFSGTLF